MDQSIKSICILRLSAIGDVCHAVATVQAIQRANPTAKITWIVGKLEATLVGDLPGVEFIVFDKSLGVAAFFAVRKRCVEPFDVLLHMQLSLRANLLAMFVRARRKLGFPKGLSKEFHTLAISERVVMPERPHVLEGFQAFAYGLNVPGFEPSWDIPVPDQAREWVQQYQSEGAQIAVIAPAASKPERSWSVQGYAAAANYLTKRGFRVILTGGPVAWERALAEDIVGSATCEIINVVGQSNLKQLLALLDAATLVIAPDTGPAHMAVTQGTPVIGLYAHSNPARTGPYVYRQYAVDVYEHHIQRQYHRASTALPWGTRAKGEQLMDDIGLPEVMAMIDRVLADLKIV